MRYITAKCGVARDYCGGTGKVTFASDRTFPLETSALAMTGPCPLGPFQPQMCAGDRFLASRHLLEASCGFQQPCFCVAVFCDGCKSSQGFGLLAKLGGAIIS